jgi:putative transposase
MPRHARVLLPGTPLHIIQRGHYRQRCFFTKADGLKYLDLLRIHLGYASASLHAYVLMPNHVHLLASFDEIDLAPHLMRCVGQGYTQDLNARMGRRGTLWDGRYRSSPVDSDGTYSCASATSR